MPRWNKDPKTKVAQDMALLVISLLPLHCREVPLLAADGHPVAGDGVAHPHRHPRHPHLHRHRGIIRIRVQGGNSTDIWGIGWDIGTNLNMIQHHGTWNCKFRHVWKHLTWLGTGLGISLKCLLNCTPGPSPAWTRSSSSPPGSCRRATWWERVKSHITKHLTRGSFMLNSWYLSIHLTGSRNVHNIPLLDGCRLFTENSPLVWYLNSQNS